jgi:hypothetical protein
MNHLNEVMKEFEKNLKQDFHISNEDMQKENIKYRRKIMIAKVKYHFIKFIRFLFPF